MVSFSAYVAGLVFFILNPVSNASSFLSRAQEANVKELTPDLEASILQEIEDVLSNSSHGISESRLSRIQDTLRTTYKSLPKTGQGKLKSAAVRYTLHSYFVQRHAWYVRGLATLGEDTGGSSPTNILQDRVEEYVQGAFEQRMGSHGLDLKETAVLAATYENLVHKELAERLDATLQLMRMTEQESMTLIQLDRVLDAYMMGYVLNLNYRVLQPSHLDTITSRIAKIYPNWPSLQGFLREVRASSSSHRSYFSRTDVEDLLELVFDQYGRWQNGECQDLKRQMLALEDKSIGVNGSGRVRLADFYGSALRDGNWQFSENADYLAQNGALDTHGSTQRVIIANYINSPSNCLASSKFYSVCCVNECEDLMDHIEHRFAEPSVAPADMVEFIASLPSASVSADRTLHPTLIQRLQEIAARYDGRVPLHSRLFAQWMHHAYPRECPFPHLTGATRPQTVKEYKSEGKRAPLATKDEMKQVVEEFSPGSGEEDSDECTKWSEHEEFYVGDHRAIHQSPPTNRRHGVWSLLRPLIYLSVVMAAAVALVQRTPPLASSKKSAGGGKDLYV